MRARWLIVMVTGLLVLSLGALFVLIGLAQADQLASTVGALAAIIGLGLSTWAIVQPRVPTSRVRTNARTSETKIYNSQGVAVNVDKQINDFRNY
jgi:hypothetical protein